MAEVMPQTREHLQIMKILGIRSGLVAISRTDLTDETIVEMAIDEVRELTQGSFLEDCPIVKVSSKTGAGLNDLKKEIALSRQKYLTGPTVKSSACISTGYSASQVSAQWLPAQ